MHSQGWKLRNEGPVTGLKMLEHLLGDSERVGVGVSFGVGGAHEQHARLAPSPERD